MEAICKGDFDKRLKARCDAEKKIEETKKKGLTNSGFVVPEIGFHEIYGVWFFGRLKEIIRQVGSERFEIDLGGSMHVFVDADPKHVAEGIHNITVYGYQCRLYKWMAQGYHRGLVVLTDDDMGNKDAEVYRHIGTWSFNEETR